MGGAEFKEFGPCSSGAMVDEKKKKTYCMDNIDKIDNEVKSVEMHIKRRKNINA